jgi:hypothetical protein
VPPIANNTLPVVLRTSPPPVQDEPCVVVAVPPPLGLGFALGLNDFVRGSYEKSRGMAAATRSLVQNATIRSCSDCLGEFGRSAPACPLASTRLVSEVARATTAILRVTFKNLHPSRPARRVRSTALRAKS